MDVGAVAGNTFDIDAYDETNSILSRTDTNGVVTNKWIWKDESDRLIQLIRTVNIGTTHAVGTPLKISAHSPGILAPTLKEDAAVAKLLAPVDFAATAFSTRTVEVDGVTKIAYLLPVHFLHQVALMSCHPQKENSFGIREHF